MTLVSATELEEERIKKCASLPNDPFGQEPSGAGHGLDGDKGLESPKLVRKLQNKKIVRYY